jgi:hypothetical protein
VPYATVEGTVAVIVPDEVALIVPIETGEAKLPVASESCAVKIFPVLHVPLIEYGTVKVLPAHNDGVETVNVFN